ncbi:MAG: hypothetical protein ACKOSS_07470 [Planctomycetia bacterium]
MRPARLMAVLLCLLLAPACGGGGSSTPSPPPPAGGLVLGEVPDAWQLTDINSASPSFQQPVGPGLSLGRASAWYFGHAT